jgi:alkyldihydroxyacetonephosphate synthase
LVPVIPYGGGSGVCGGTIPISGGVIVDVKRLGRIESIDHTSLTVRAQAGINGQQFEDQLNAQGLTLGHFPSSIMCSTLGGWLAARSAGQFSSRYGKIEDMVLSLRAVLADGTIVDTANRGPGDPDWTQLLVGSEGTLGLITSAELKVQASPELREFRAFRFRQLDQGLRGARALMQAGLRPIVMRLYDPFDSMIALGKDPEAKRSGPLDLVRGLFGAGKDDAANTEAPKGFLGRLGARAQPFAEAAKRTALTTALSAPSVINALAHAVPSPCLMIVGFEGPAETVHVDAFAARELLLDAGGIDAGSGPGDAWFERRYSVGFKQTKVFQMGAFADTMEVATTWDRLEGLHEAVRKALSPHVFLMAHFSHAYREGCSIYFTFVGYRRDTQRLEQHYDRVWRLATEAVIRAGGTVSHHHGVGLSKKGAMAQEHGQMLRVWRALKDVVDPHRIMNPGKLFPDDAGQDSTGPISGGPS